MAKPPRQPPVDALLAETRRIQVAASDPARSAWVSANAGTGKTYVLAARVLRILLAGTPPEAILCLTYTKAAAAEMSARVLDRLATWVVAPETVLVEGLRDLLDRAPSTVELRQARTLFARTIETPGGLKVQTIHAFCERLLQQFPLEAGVPAGFTTLEDGERASLIEAAIDQVLAAAGAAPDGQLARALGIVVPYAVEEGFSRLIGETIAARDWLRHLSEMAPLERSGRALEDLYARLLGIVDKRTVEAIEAEMAGLIPTDLAHEAVAALAAGSKSDKDGAERLAALIAAGSAAGRIGALSELLLTQKGEARARLMTKTVATAHPAVEMQLRRAQERLLVLSDAILRARLAAGNVALMTLGSAVMQRYSEAKARRGALDFDDLIEGAASLLHPEGAPRARGDVEGASISEWVLFKLDSRLQHILVDEAQDTSPAQWRVVEALAGEFFSGEGAHGALTRTLFVVGDEKQSIYSFQGAAPDAFRRMGEALEGRARAAGQDWKRLSMTLSFRSTAPVLKAVDGVLAAAQGADPGAGSVAHHVRRLGQAGLVELWPPVIAERIEAGAAFEPLDSRQQSDPPAQLAGRVADAVAALLQAPPDERVRAGDILILLRKRRPLAPAIISALKARGIPVAGADRLRLGEQIAVEDLIALGDFLLLPEHDLALAAVLKSPLGGLDDALLEAIAAARPGTLWGALMAAAAKDGADPRLPEVVARLKIWRSRADLVPPYELYAGILDRDGGRARMLARLGPEAADALDAFLNQAIEHDSLSTPSLVGFLDRLRRRPVEVKRDMEPGGGAVRVMTVHGAKGLEAPVVIMPDTCGLPSPPRAVGVLRLPLGKGDPGPAPVLWPLKGTRQLDVVSRAVAARAEAERAEHDRLLYVALTRARDRLYIGGLEGVRGRPAGCWYDTIEAALAPIAEAIEGPGGRTLRLSAPQEAPSDQRAAGRLPEAVPSDPPAWMSRPAPSEPQRRVPVAPSRLLPLEVDETGEATAIAPRPDREPGTPSPLVSGDGRRFLRGTLTHTLLEHLPTLPRATWDAGARALLRASGHDLAPTLTDSIVRETIAVLETPGLAALFGPGSRAEAALVAELASPAGGPALRINATIDRLLVTDKEVLIADFKTNRPPPRDIEGVPAAYLLQLAAYRVAARRVWGARRVRCALVWTDGPSIMEIGTTRLDAIEPEVWGRATEWG